MKLFSVRFEMNL